MSQLHNLHRSFCKSPVTVAGFLGLPLVWLLVGGSFTTAANAQTVVQTGPFADTSTLTNLVWADAQECRDYIGVVSNRLLSIKSDATLQITRADEIYSGVVRINSQAQTIIDNTESGSIASNTARDIRTATNPISTLRLNARDISADAQEIVTRCDYILDTELPTYYQATFATSSVDSGSSGGESGGESGGDSGGESGGESGSCSGCCECPDYTDYIDDLESVLSTIRQDLRNWYVEWYDFAEYMWDVMEALGEGFGGAASRIIYQYSDSASTYGKWSNIGYSLGLVLTNQWKLARDIGVRWAKDGTFVATEYHDGEGLSSAIWNELLVPYASLLAPASWTDPFVDNPMVGSVRDYFMRGRYNFPTNTAEMPLYVTTSTNTATLVDFDETALKDLLEDIEYKVINGSKSFHVIVDQMPTQQVEVVENVHQSAQQVEANVDVFVDVAQSLTGDLATYDDIDEDISDYSTMFDFTDLVKRYVGVFTNLLGSSYRDYSEMPPMIIIYSGFSPNNGNDSGTDIGSPWGGWSQIIDIPTLTWNPAEDGGAFVLRGIRKISRFCWSLLFFFVMGKVVKMNLFLCRAGLAVLFAVAGALMSRGQSGGFSISDAYSVVFETLGNIYTSMFGTANTD